MKRVKTTLLALVLATTFSCDKDDEIVCGVPSTRGTTYYPKLSYHLRIILPNGERTDEYTITEKSFEELEAEYRRIWSHRSGNNLVGTPDDCHIINVCIEGDKIIEIENDCGI